MESDTHNKGVNLKTEEDQKAFVNACMKLNWSVEHIAKEANLPQYTVEQIRWEILNKRYGKNKKVL